MSLTTDTPPNFRRRRVLIVDDEPQIRAVARLVLEMEGFDVVDVGRVEEALMMVATDPRLDLILSDVSMPGLNGMDLASFVLRERPELPVVFMTAIDRRSVLHQALESRSRFLYKPFTGEDLCAVAVDAVTPDHAIA